MKAHLTRLWQVNSYARNIRRFRLGVLSVLLLEIALLFPTLPTMAFDRGFSLPKDFDIPLHFQLFYLPQTPAELKTLVLAFMALIALQMLNPSRLGKFATWVLTASFHYRFRGVIDAGSSLMDIWTLMLIFLTEDSPDGSLRSQLETLASNLAFNICRLQLCVVYAMAGAGKLLSPLWLEGNSLYYILSKPIFSHPGAQLALQSPLVLTAANYLTIVFQITFPLAVWSRKLRPYWLMVGTLIHLSIVFVMGLVTFGFIMCASYSLFSDRRFAFRFEPKNLFRQVGQSIARRIPDGPLFRTLAVLGIFFAVFHFVMIIVLISPGEIWPKDTRSLAARYLLPEFPQVWLLFGPQVGKSYLGVHYRCGLNGPWHDPTTSLSLAQQRHRFSAIGYMNRALDNLVREVANQTRALEAQCQGTSPLVCQKSLNANIKKVDSFNRLMSVISEFCDPVGDRDLKLSRELQARLIEATPTDPGERLTAASGPSLRSRTLPPMKASEIAL